MSPWSASLSRWTPYPALHLGRNQPTPFKRRRVVHYLITGISQKILNFKHQFDCCQFVCSRQRGKANIRSRVFKSSLNCIDHPCPRRGRIHTQTSLSDPGRFMTQQGCNQILVARGVFVDQSPKHPMRYRQLAKVSLISCRGKYAIDVKGRVAAILHGPRSMPRSIAIVGVDGFGQVLLLR